MLNNNCYIYAIINRTNGKVYVGQTTRTPMVRFFEHSNPRKRGKKSKITHAILNEGQQNFYVRVLEVCTQTMLNDREKFWIKQLHAWKTMQGYNRTMGGQNTAIEPIRRRRKRRHQKHSKKK